MGRRRGLELPAWPVVGWIVSLPIGWLLGVGFLLPALWSTVAAALLLARGRVLLPRVGLVWIGFLLLVVLSMLMLDGPQRLIGATFRLVNYLGASVAFLYVYNAPRVRLSDARVGGLLVAFWAWVVVGGWLAILVPDGGLTTPAAGVMPQVLLDNELVREWVHPRFAEVQQPWGAPVPFARPSAPFTYTNSWGVNYALLLPFVVAALVQARGARRAVIGAGLAASVVPAAATLNRGMFIAVAVAVVYVGARAALAGRLGPLLAITAAGGVAAIGFVVSGGAERLLFRLSVSETNETRGRIYREAFERTVESPFVGWGAPRPSETMDLSVGTQGHVWNVMFSHGFVALLLFVATVWWLAWRTRRAPAPFGAAAHVTLVIAAITIAYYGYDGTQLLVAMLAAAIGCRAIDQVAETPSTPPAPGGVDRPEQVVAGAG